MGTCSMLMQRKIISRHARLRLKDVKRIAVNLKPKDLFNEAEKKRKAFI